MNRATAFEDEAPNAQPDVGLAPTARVHRLVLDTNVSLALWLFADPTLAALDRALRDGRCRWVSSPALWAELVHEVRPERCTRLGLTPERVLATIGTIPLDLREAPPCPSVPANLRCKDPDDQVFVDFALASGAHALLSRDRAVLARRRPAAVRGLTICDPRDWIRHMGWRE